MSAGFHLGLVRRRRGCFRVSQATAILLNGPFNSKAGPFAGELFRSVVNEAGSHWQGAWSHDMMGTITGGRRPVAAICSNRNGGKEILS